MFIVENANRKIKLVDFIPAISVIAGSSFNFDNRFNMMICFIN